MTPDGVIKDLPDTWDAHDPTWSPDGREIAYGHPDGLFVIRPDGSGPRQLTPGDIQVQGPQYSPDGRQIAFCRSELVGSKVEYS